MMLRVAAVLMLVLISAPGCRREPPPSPYTPGLGEIMTLTQMRHTKLWFAGQAGNWPLAAYEVDELKEGFEDAARFHPTHKDAPLPISELIPKMTAEPVRPIEDAIAARNAGHFVETYDALTSACNSCHRATNFGFNVVGRPTTNPYTNQVFEPAH